MSVTATFEGVDRFVDTLEAAGRALVDLDLDPLAGDLQTTAIPRTRVRSGRLRDTVRASVVDDDVILEAGGGDVDYAGIVHAYDPWLSESIAATPVVDLVVDQVAGIVSTIQGK